MMDRLQGRFSPSWASLMQSHPNKHPKLFPSFRPFEPFPNLALQYCFFSNSLIEIFSHNYSLGIFSVKQFGDSETSVKLIENMQTPYTELELSDSIEICDDRDIILLSLSRLYNRIQSIATWSCLRMRNTETCDRN